MASKRDRFRPVSQPTANWVRVEQNDVHQQPRVFRELDQASIAVEVFLVVILEEAHARELAVRESGQTARPMQRKPQPISTEDSVAHIEANEGEQLSGD